MIGAVAGDIMGSPFEWNNTDDFFFHPTEGSYAEIRGRRVHFEPKYTDDTVLTLAVASWLMTDREHSRKGLVSALQGYARMYPRAGYGPMFREWVMQDRPKANKSFGNGAAMRVSPVGLYAQTKEECLALAELTAKVSHDHPEAIKGAKAIAYCVWLAKRKHTKEEIKRWVEVDFGYDLDTPLEERTLALKGVVKEPILVNGEETGEFYLRDTGRFDASCQVTVPAAIRAFLEGSDFESVTRKAVAAGGDSDTIAAMAASIADPFYGGVPKKFSQYYSHLLDSKLSSTMNSFENYLSAGKKEAAVKEQKIPSNIVKIIKFSGFRDTPDNSVKQNFTNCLVFADDSRPAMANAIKEKFGNDVIVHPYSEFDAAVKALAESGSEKPSTRLVPVPDETRTFYLEGGELKTISTTESYGSGKLDERLAARDTFLHLRHECSLVRDELQRRCGYDGPLKILFESAVYPVVRTERVDIMEKGDVIESIYIDPSNGKLRITSNDIFRSDMKPDDIIAALRGKCLDEGISSGPAKEGDDIHFQVYEKKAPVRNLEVACRDIDNSMDIYLNQVLENPELHEKKDERKAQQVEVKKPKGNKIG